MLSKRTVQFARVVGIAIGVLLQLYGEMASRLQRLDLDLEKCYENDLDWTLLPEKLREVSICMVYFFGNDAVLPNAPLFKINCP